MNDHYTAEALALLCTHECTQDFEDGSHWTTCPARNFTVVTRVAARLRELSEREVERIYGYLGVDPDDVCHGCGGVGRKTYGSTATWHGGIGGQMMTNDVCNNCWGSGRKSHPWVNLRAALARKENSGG